MFPQNSELIDIIKKCLRGLYASNQPEDSTTSALKEALHERLAQLEMQELLSFPEERPIVAVYNHEDPEMLA